MADYNEMGTSYIDEMMYDAGGHTGKTYYARFVCRSKPYDSYVWDDVSKILKASTTWAASAVVLVEDGTTGAFPVVIDALMQVGTYDVIIYEQAGSTPSNTDDVTKQYQTRVGGIHKF